MVPLSYDSVFTSQSGLGRERHAYSDDLTCVIGIQPGVSFPIYPQQGILSQAIQLELEDETYLNTRIPFSKNWEAVVR